MKKRKVFLAKKKGGGRNVNEVEIVDMEVMKSARKHDKLQIASLKRKLTRETARKKRAQGEEGSDEDVFASSYEDASNITEATKNSGASVRNALKKSKRAVKAISRKQTRFAPDDDEE